MAKHHIMDATGHSTVEFDKANTVDLDAAMKRFAALTGAGHVAATRGLRVLVCFSRTGNGNS